MTPGRLLLPALRAAPDGTFDHEQAAIAALLEHGAGGVILFGGSRTTVRALVAELQQRAGRALLVASDLERGAGQQVQGLTELPPPGALAALDDPAAVRAAGSLTGAEARAVGINWVFAPVADLDLLAANPIVQSRAFGADPARAAALAHQWILGCERAGALACAKHFPGHGRTALDSHEVLPTVDVPLAELLATDLAPFREAADAGVASMMTAHVAFPRWDPSGVPATRSAPMLQWLRRELGYDGLLVSDAMNMAGARDGRPEGEAEVDALAAGVDLLLYPTDMPAILAAIDRAMASGRLSRQRVDEALRRYQRALARAGRSPLAPPPDASALADELADRVLAATWPAALPALRWPLEVTVVDDDVGGPFAPNDPGALAAGLAQAGVPLGTGGSRVLAVFAEPRAWKGRAGLGPAAHAALAAAGPVDLVVLFGHPRLSAELGTAAPVLVAWHRQRLMQRAVARRLAASRG
ncbi:MAG: glycoside hydrolase family 3 N-terminal domain-containing protein [Gemmatimonadales bacterium]|nr:glycoside hydrolase family 3 N-terminal domain-containing protein [Gemmatimonadales bacterium]